MTRKLIALWLCVLPWLVACGQPGELRHPEQPWAPATSSDPS